MKRFKQRSHSLVFQITFGMILLTLVMLAVLMFSNLYSYRVVTGNTVDAFSAAQNLYIRQVTQSKKAITQGISENAGALFSDIILYENLSNTKRHILHTQWQDKLKTRIDYTDAADFFFVLNADEELSLVATHSRIKYTDKLNTIEFFKKIQSLDNDTLTDEWHLIMIGDSPALIKTYRASNFYIGGGAFLSTLYRIIPSDILPEDIQCLITDMQGNVLYTFGNQLMAAEALENDLQLLSNYKDKWFILTGDSAPLRVSMVKKSESIYLGLEFSFWLILGLGLFLLGLIILGSFYMFRQIIKPINALYKGTKELKKGHFDYRIPETTKPDEFAALTHSFNTMSEEIHSLKIASYEAQLETQRNELRFLHMQIRPHFYLNAITTISSFAYQNRSSDLQAYTEAFSNYLRYLFRQRTTSIPLMDEIASCEAYIELFRLKDPSCVYGLTDITPEAQAAAIPKYLILTLTENAFKYAYRQGQLLTIFIRAYVEDGRLFIVVEDNGPGFTIEAIENFPPKEDEKRIGLGNLYRTLFLTYQTPEAMSISNLPTGGARIVIQIPISKEDGHVRTDR